MFTLSPEQTYERYDDARESHYYGAAYYGPGARGKLRPGAALAAAVVDDGDVRGVAVDRLGYFRLLFGE